MKKTILFNGCIHTMDVRQPIAEAVAIRDGLFVAVGHHEEVLGFLGTGVEKVDLEGKTVIPGLIDSHIHFLHFALGLSQIDLDAVPTLTACVSNVRERIERTEPGGWIVGRGWNYNHWPEERFPRKDDLDPISPAHPVVLSSKDGHLLWVNSKALEAAGIDRNTADPPGGQIERDVSGEPTGLMKENAGGAIWRVVPSSSERVRLDALRNALPIAHSKGLTGLHVPEGRDSWSAFGQLREQGELAIRVLMMIPVCGLDEAIRLGLRSGFGDAWIRIGPVKLFVDGALGGQTAAMREPYEGNPGNSGILTITEEELGEVVSRASAAGINIAPHAIGDRANRMVLDAVEASGDVIQAHGLRPRIEHAQLLRASDFGRLAELGIIASMQPIHATSDWRMADRHWGARTRYAYAWRSVLNAGAPLAFGSDSPVETLDPFKGIYAAVTRREENGAPEGGWVSEQCLRVKEAVSAYTMGAAFAAGEETIKGSISVGKVADLVVLSGDIFSGPPERILEAKAERTMIGGNFEYRR